MMRRGQRTTYLVMSEAKTLDEEEEEEEEKGGQTLMRRKRLNFISFIIMFITYSVLLS